MKLKNISNIEVGSNWFRFKPKKKLGKKTGATEVLISFYYTGYMVEISAPGSLYVYEDVKIKEIQDILSEHFEKKIKCNKKDIIDILAKREN